MTFTAEPLEPQKSGPAAIVYLRVAPTTSAGKPVGHLNLRLRITNQEAKAVRLTGVGVEFGGPPEATGAKFDADLEIEPSKSKTWTFRRNKEVDETIVLPHPGPASVTVALWFQGNNQPVTQTFPLAPHRSPTPLGSYRFPARAADFRFGEFWSGSSGRHATGSEGSQLFAYDMGVVGWDPSSKEFTGRVPGVDTGKNESFRIWGKPITAMADGTVLEAVSDCPDNPHPLTWSSEEELEEKMAEQKKLYWGSYPHGGAGNHLYVQHGDEVALYAHLQKGSVPQALRTAGAKVKVGQVLGLAGNSGNSTSPHLHIHVIQGTAPESGTLRPLPFQDAWAVDRGKLASMPDPKGPWAKLDDEGLPEGTLAVWPGPGAPTMYPPGWAEVARHGVPAAQYQAVFNQIAGSGYRPVWVNGFEVNGSTYYNAIFRPADGTAWAARHGLDGDAYQAEFNARTAEGFRLLHVDAYRSAGAVRYACIFVKAAGPAWKAYHGRTPQEHQQLFNQYTAEGFRPRIASVADAGGSARIAALYEKVDVGAFEARTGMTAQEYQQHFDANVKAGRELSYVKGYNVGGAAHFSAIWEAKAGPFAARHGLTSAEYQAAFEQNLGAGRLTRAVSGYEAGNQARYAAYWRK